MEKQYCKRCHATKSVELFDGIHKYCTRCLEKRRELYQNTKEKYKERQAKYSQKYYSEHKEELNEKKKEFMKTFSQIEIECDICNCKIKKYKLSQHLATNKHKENEKQKKDEEEKIKQMNEEELDEYLKIKKLKSIWKNVRL